MDLLTTIGLGLITIGWLVQLYTSVAKKHKEFDFKFLALYAVGAFALAYGGFSAGDFMLGGLNFIAGIAALVVGFYTR